MDFYPYIKTKIMTQLFTNLIFLAKKVILVPTSITLLAEKSWLDRNIS